MGLLQAARYKDKAIAYEFQFCCVVETDKDFGTYSQDVREISANPSVRPGNVALFACHNRMCRLSCEVLSMKRLWAQRAPLVNFVDDEDRQGQVKEAFNSFGFDF